MLVACVLAYAFSMYFIVSIYLWFHKHPKGDDFGTAMAVFMFLYAPLLPAIFALAMVGWMVDYVFTDKDTHAQS